MVMKELQVEKKKDKKRGGKTAHCPHKYGGHWIYYYPEITEVELMNVMMMVGNAIITISCKL